MVGGVSETERSAFARKLKIGFVLLVGFSAGLITLYADAGVVFFAVATAIGLGTGVVLVWLVFPERRELERGGDGRSRRRK
jgi:ammonia channel protein AmtB